MRLFVTYPCQPPGGVTKTGRSLFSMTPVTPHLRIDLGQRLLRQKSRLFCASLCLARESTVRSHILKRSVVLNGSRTSVSLENKFWDALQEIARREKLTTSALVERIAGDRESDNLSSEIRVFVLDYFRTRAGLKPFSNELGSGFLGRDLC